MAHSLIRIKGSLVNTPHLMEPTSFHTIMDYVNQRIEGNADLTPPEVKAEHDPYAGKYVPETKMGVMNISGPITNKTSGWEAMCGGTSYEMMKEQMEYFVESGAKTVVMMVDSGGGEAKSMIDSANYIRKLANENGIRIVAYVDGMSASAAYGISCVADEIVMASDSQVGSIGVLIQLMNNSKALEKAGYERTFITAGKDKVPFADDGSFTKEFIAGLQEQVDTLYEAFTSHVATHRSIDLSVVKGTEANVFMGEQAIKLGLADKIMTVEEFYEYAAVVAEQNTEGTTDMKNPFKFGKQEDVAEMAKLEEMKALLEAEGEARATAEASLVTMAASLTEATAAIGALKAELDSLKAAQVDAEAAAAAAALAKREAALAEVVPAAEVENYMTNMASLDEGAFAFMVASLKASKDARAAEMQEVGEEGAQDEDAPVDRLEAIKQAGIAAARAQAQRR